MFRSSRPEVFCKKGVTEKHLFQSLFLNKVAGQAWNFVKKETLAQVFSYEFCEISQNVFFCRTPGDCFWLWFDNYFKKVSF